MSIRGDVAELWLSPLENALAYAPDQYALPGMHALGRMGEPEELAETFVWLSSDRASFLTGSFIPVDGGYLAR